MVTSKSFAASDDRLKFYAQYSVEGDGQPLMVHRTYLLASSSSAAVSKLREEHSGYEIRIRVLRVVDTEVRTSQSRTKSQWVLILLSALVAVIALLKSVLLST